LPDPYIFRAEASCVAEYGARDFGGFPDRRREVTL
jgi:hypothetical protein